MRVSGAVQRYLSVTSTIAKHSRHIKNTCGKFGDGYFQQNQTARTIPEKYLRTAFIDYGQGVGRDGILVTAPKIPSLFSTPLKFILITENPFL